MINRDRRITLHLATKDRPSEVGMLLESLRHQTIQDWDLIIVDDGSKQPLNSIYFINYLMQRLKLEKHDVKIIRNNISGGCCKARNLCIEHDKFENMFTCRLDDDTVLNEDYFEKLLEVIDDGYDIASGVVPLMVYPEHKRKITAAGDIINEHKLDTEGNLISNADDCGYCYTENKIIPTHQFRTSALYKSKIHEKVKYPTFISSVAFREEGFFSFKAILAGYKIGVHTGAICYHFQTPSGGNRRVDYADCVKQDDESFKKWVKRQFEKHGDFLANYNEVVLK